jgi:hypothetical protein
MRPPRQGSRWSAGRVQRRGRYTAYIESDDWFRRREQWHTEHVETTSAEPTCAVCDQTWTLNRDDLHHRTYDRLGHELHSDLIPLCRTHHRAVHDLWDASPAWRRLGRVQATAGIISILRRRQKGQRS